VVRRLNPGSTAISQNLAGIVAEFAGREWQHSAGQAPAEFQLVSNDERGWLDALG
jgi:hypothetical protein